MVEINGINWLLPVTWLFDGVGKDLMYRFQGILFFYKEPSKGKKSRESVTPQGNLIYQLEENSEVLER